MDLLCHQQCVNVFRHGVQADKRPIKDVTLSQQDHWQANSASWCISAAGQRNIDGEQIKQLVIRVGQPGAYSRPAAI